MVIFRLPAVPSREKMTNGRATLLGFVRYKIPALLIDAAAPRIRYVMSASKMHTERRPYSNTMMP